MKKILVTGAGSYIGTCFARYMAQWPADYTVDTVDMMGDGWQAYDFTGYDAVYHVAGIAHIKETEENAYQYYRVNCDLALHTAQKAEESGVPLFVFLSSMSVYGLEEGAITPDTVPAPKSHYGKSKWEAEQELDQMESDAFRVAILRPPMVYGEGCKGNYQSLVTFAKKLPVFADYKNTRSMLHVDNLSACVKEIIDSGKGGLYLPQDPAYVCTCRMIQQIAADRGKKMPLWKVLNPLVWLLKAATTKGKKAFGDLYYVK